MVEVRPKLNPNGICEKEGVAWQNYSKNFLEKTTGEIRKKIWNKTNDGEQVWKYSPDHFNTYFTYIWEKVY